MIIPTGRFFYQLSVDYYQFPFPHRRQLLCKLFSRLELSILSKSPNLPGCQHRHAGLRLANAARVTSRGTDIKRWCSRRSWRETTKDSARRVQDLPEQLQQAAFLWKVGQGKVFGTFCAITSRGGTRRTGRATSLFTGNILDKIASPRPIEGGSARYDW